jgi:hypothetical protein
VAPTCRTVQSRAVRQAIPIIGPGHCNEASHVELESVLRLLATPNAGLA